MLPPIFLHFSHWEGRSMPPHLEFGCTCECFSHTSMRKVNLGHKRPGSFHLALSKCISSSKVSSQNPAAMLWEVQATCWRFWWQSQMNASFKSSRSRRQAREWETHNARDPTAYLFQPSAIQVTHRHLSLSCWDSRRWWAEPSHSCYVLYKLLTFRIWGHNKTVVFFSMLLSGLFMPLRVFGYAIIDNWKRQFLQSLLLIHLH